MMAMLLPVALGGAIGASLRHLVGAGVVRVFGAGQFPAAILGVNVVGCFLMGIGAIVLTRQGLHHLNPFVATGILGGFTTFSAFSLETMRFLEGGDLTYAALYVGLSVVLSVVALWAGAALARGIVA